MPRGRPQALQNFRLSIEIHRMAPLEAENPYSDGSRCDGQMIPGFGVIQFLPG